MDFIFFIPPAGRGSRFTRGPAPSFKVKHAWTPVGIRFHKTNKKIENNDT